MNSVCYSAMPFLSSFTYVFAYTHPSEKYNRVNKVIRDLYYDEIDKREENVVINTYKLYENNPNSSRFDISMSLTPKTELVKKLLALRRKYLENGGTLLDLEGIANEVKSRRGGLYNGEEDIP
jgi:hypothetical protein